MKKCKPPRRPTGDYPVGNCRPPVETRFKPGQSGNPTGRPKKTLTVEALAAKLLRERIPVIENGKKRKIESQEIILRAARKDAMSGNLKAAEKLFRLAQPSSVPSVEVTDDVGGRLEDEELFEAFKRDLTLGELASASVAGNVEVPESGTPQAVGADADRENYLNEPGRGTLPALKAAGHLDSPSHSVPTGATRDDGHNPDIPLTFGGLVGK